MLYLYLYFCLFPFSFFILFVHIRVSIRASIRVSIRVCMSVYECVCVRMRLGDHKKNHFIKTNASTYIDTAHVPNGIYKSNNMYIALVRLGSIWVFFGGNETKE